MKKKPLIDLSVSIAQCKYLLELEKEGKPQPTLPIRGYYQESKQDWDEDSDIDTESWGVLFSYDDRYLLKKNDKSKQVYCEDPAISKKYANTLKQVADKLIFNSYVFFDQLKDKYEFLMETGKSRRVKKYVYPEDADDADNEE